MYAMYATIAKLDGGVAVIYIGKNQKTADDLAEQTDGDVVVVETLEELSSALTEREIAAKISDFAEGLSDAAKKVLDKLKIDDPEELGRKLREQGEKTVAEVRSLGIKGMKVVGDGFINLGQLLKKDDQDDG